MRFQKFFFRGRRWGNKTGSAKVTLKGIALIFLVALLALLAGFYQLFFNPTCFWSLENSSTATKRVMQVKLEDDFQVEDTGALVQESPVRRRDDIALLVVGISALVIASIAVATRKRRR